MGGANSKFHRDLLMVIVNILPCVLGRGERERERRR